MSPTARYFEVKCLTGWAIFVAKFVFVCPERNVFATVHLLDSRNFDLTLAEAELQITA